MTPWGPTLIVLGAIGVVVLAVVLIICRLEDKPLPEEFKQLQDRPGDDDQFAGLADEFQRMRKHREETGRFRPVAPETERSGQPSPLAGPLTPTSRERTP